MIVPTRPIHSGAEYDYRESEKEVAAREEIILARLKSVAHGFVRRDLNRTAVAHFLTILDLSSST
jgi:hypothetical protein